MNEQEALALANLLSLLIPLGVKAYTQIQQNHSDKLSPIADILASSDADWDAIKAKAKEQIAGL
jgi:hypothetical protein